MAVRTDGKSLMEDVAAVSQMVVEDGFSSKQDVDWLENELDRASGALGDVEDAFKAQYQETSDNHAKDVFKSLYNETKKLHDGVRSLWSKASNALKHITQNQESRSRSTRPLTEQDNPTIHKIATVIVKGDLGGMTSEYVYIVDALIRRLKRDIKDWESDGDQEAASSGHQALAALKKASQTMSSVL